MSHERFGLLWAVAGVAALLSLGGCGETFDGPVSCSNDGDCLEEEVCLTEVGVCAPTCDSAADCPDSAKVCAAIAGSQQKVCQCSTTPLCNSDAPPDSDLVCSADVGVCLTSCTAGGSCPSGFDCDTASGECRRPTEGFQLTSGQYRSSAASNINDGCNVNPNDSTNPIEGTQLPLENNNGTISFGSLGGNPQQPSNGTGTLQGNSATLNRDNEVTTTDGCTFNRRVENVITLTADDRFTTQYTRTDSNHVGTCTRTTSCTSSYTLSYTRVP